MMKPIPLADNILCELVSNIENDTTLVVYETEKLPVYKIIAIGNTLDSSRYSIGDKIIVNSTGTKLHLESKINYLFKVENIIGKVID